MINFTNLYQFELIRKNMFYMIGNFINISVYDSVWDFMRIPITNSVWGSVNTSINNSINDFSIKNTNKNSIINCLEEVYK